MPESVRGAVRNNGGGHANHSLFWSILTPITPSGELADAIETSFGSYDAFKESLYRCCNSVGEGWAWLGVEADGSLCMLVILYGKDDHVSILGLDVGSMLII